MTKEDLAALDARVAKLEATSHELNQALSKTQDALAQAHSLAQAMMAMLKRSEERWLRLLEAVRIEVSRGSL